MDWLIAVVVLTGLALLVWGQICVERTIHEIEQFLGDCNVQEMIDKIWIGDYHRKEYERLKADFQTLPTLAHKHSEAVRQFAELVEELD